MELRWAVLALTLHWAAQAAPGTEYRLTIYNQNFAVVRQTVLLDLVRGVSSVRFSDITARLEPNSVILRDPTGKRVFQILEQNYRSDSVSQGLLLSVYEGKTIDFLVQNQDKTVVLPGKIIRSGYLPSSEGLQRYAPQYYVFQPAPAASQPIIEVEGKLRFTLPGIPLFPALTDDAILKPALAWQIQSDQAGEVEAELGYVTGGMSWQADYNIVAPEEGEVLEISGWVSIDNQSGKNFENAVIKLMAGDVSKIQPRSPGAGFGVAGTIQSISPPPVSEKVFDDYHLYSLSRPATLYDRETKQVEFIRAKGVKSERVYVYDGVKIDQDRYRSWNPSMILQDREYGVKSNPVVWVMREFANSEANHLGMALPKGRVRFYRRDKDNQLEFTGENTIEHTPRDETVRVFSGSAFDLVGERRRTDYRIDTARRCLDESFDIKLRNHKKETVEVRAVEHLYRSTSWGITEESSAHVKTDSQTIEFRIEVGPGQERFVTYTVRYTW